MDDTARWYERPIRAFGQLARTTPGRFMVAAPGPPANAASPATVQRAAESPLRLAGKLATFMAMSETVNVAEFKDRLSELLAFVERGGEVVVCRRNVPLARVEPIRHPALRKARRSVVGCLKGTVRIQGDLTEPCIPEADWEMLK